MSNFFNLRVRAVKSLVLVDCRLNEFPDKKFPGQTVRLYKYTFLKEDNEILQIWSKNDNYSSHVVQLKEGEGYSEKKSSDVRLIGVLWGGKMKWRFDE